MLKQSAELCQLLVGTEQPVCAAALSGRQAELEGAYSAGSAFLQSHLGIQSVGERSRILDTAMNRNSMYALRPNGKGIVNGWVRCALWQAVQPPTTSSLEDLGLLLCALQHVLCAYRLPHAIQGWC